MFIRPLSLVVFFTGKNYHRSRTFFFFFLLMYYVWNMVSIFIIVSCIPTCKTITTSPISNSSSSSPPLSSPTSPLAPSALFPTPSPNRSTPPPSSLSVSRTLPNISSPSSMTLKPFSHILYQTRFLLISSSL